MPLAADVDLGALARQAEGLSGSDLAALGQRAALAEIRARIDAERSGASGAVELRIAQQRFVDALADVRKQLSVRARPTSSLLRLPTRVAPVGRP
jgi:SpoVK/Ycf46/Vps4 family AAA+-type ATPase